MYCYCTYDQIPLSSANEDLQPVLSAKRRILALNKKDLANPNIMNVRMAQSLSLQSSLSSYLHLKNNNLYACWFNVLHIFQLWLTYYSLLFTFSIFTFYLQRWLNHFESCKQDCISVNAHSCSSVNQVNYLSVSCLCIFVIETSHYIFLCWKVYGWVSIKLCNSVVYIFFIS